MHPKADINHIESKCPLLANSGHSKTFSGPISKEIEPVVADQLGADELMIQSGNNLRLNLI
jgi:hypothetical protein